MNLIKKISVLTVISVLMTTNIIFAQNYYENKTSTIKTIESNARSQRIPVGTRIKMRMEKPINSLNSSRGEPFIATLIDDIYVDGNAVLPAGTTLRGRVGKIKKSTFLSRGGELGLNFDLVETPIGRQIPFAAKISSSKYLTPDGTLSAGGGYLNALSQNLENGVNILTNISSYSIKKGLSVAHGVPVILTAPLGVVGGTFVGSTVFFGKSVSALYHKGENVRLNPGDILEITVMQPFNVPLI